MRWRNRSWLVARLLEKLARADGSSEKFDGLSERDAETLATWSDAARERRPVLFVGAGWTANAIAAAPRHGEHRDTEPRALLWKELSRKLRGALAHDVPDTDLDPLWLAELYRQRHGDDGLHTLLRDAVPDDQLQPGPLHDALTNVRWKTILTTNYDSLLTRTFSPLRRVHVCVDDTDLVRSAAPDALELVHLHGVLDRPKTIVLAYEDYRRYPAAHPGLIAKVRQLFLQHPVLFVGFGVTDPNFLQWAGWLADVGREIQNPWVSLTLDPPPGVSHGRYWGTRLNFVSITPFSRFREVVPHVLGRLGEALEASADRRTEEVARVRIGFAKNADEAMHELRGLLRTGQAHGAEGSDWDRFQGTLFNLVASHLLDLAKAAWRERPPVKKDEALNVFIDMRPPDLQERDDGLIAQLHAAFGGFWRDWCALLRPLVGDWWRFERVDLSGARFSDIWNVTSVPLTNADEATSVSGGKPAPGGGSPGDAGDSQVDALRGINLPEKPAMARSSWEHRLLGYLACQQGEWRRAADHYEAAALQSRAEREAVRREWWSLRSQRVCLDSIVFRDASEDRDSLKADRLALVKKVDGVKELLAHGPVDERDDPIVEDALDAERKVSAQLVDDLDRDDADETLRMGQVYGSAAEWLLKLERMWVAPPLIGAAADALGTLQWRYGELVEGARTLARYGSTRLAKLTRARSRSTYLAPGFPPDVIDELLRHGRWPGEWAARADAILEVVPSCSDDQLAKLGEFVEEARKTFAANTGRVVRGTSTTFAWSEQATIERVESMRWPLLAPADALEAIERWTESGAGGGALSMVPESPRALVALDRVPWKSWTTEGHIEGARVARLLTRLCDVRLAAPRRPGVTVDLEVTLNLVLALADRMVVSISADTLLRRAVDQVISKLSEADRTIFEASLARLDGDNTKLESLVSAAVDALLAGGKTLPQSLLDVIGIGPSLAAPHIAKIMQLFDERISSLEQQLSRGHAPSVWNADETAGMLAFTLGRFLASGVPEASVTEAALRLMKLVPSTADYLAASSSGVPALKSASEHAIVDLLRGGSMESRLSRRQQQFRALRGVTKTLVQKGAAELSREWIASAATLPAADESVLATYATWILSEWIVRRAGDHWADLLASAVGPALRMAASDPRTTVRAHAARGVRAMLVGPMGTDARAENERILERLGRDQSAAVRRALEGTGALAPF